MEKIKAEKKSSFILHTRAGDLDLSKRVHVMGILNVTPDSFSDGGQFLSPEAAIARGETMVEEGADILDIGGESTRPGAPPVSLEEEISRVIPIVEILAQRLPNVPISVDTTKAEVARRALAEGASILNDISALTFDPGMVPVLKEHGVPVVLMHMQGTPATMQKNPAYADVVADVRRFFQERISWCAGQGLTNQIILDPGLGFGKTLEHNLEILRRLAEFKNLSHPILIGASRKSFLGRILSEGKDPVSPENRLEGSLAAALLAAQAGCGVVRVHDVLATRRALSVWSAIAGHGTALIK
jgi:dihydropteroate synthase